MPTRSFASAVALGVLLSFSTTFAQSSLGSTTSVSSTGAIVTTPASVSSSIGSSTSTGRSTSTTTPGSTTTSPAQVTGTAISSSAEDLETIYERRIPDIVEQFQTSPTPSDKTFNTWLSGFKDGQFADVDYTAGCTARRANWPAQVHWNHINSLASAYKGLFQPVKNTTTFAPSKFAGNTTVKNILSSAMDWWFDNDFEEDTCVDHGGVANSSCPCGTPGLWNPNWFSNMILIPRLSLYACLLLNDELTTNQRQSCIHIGERGYAGFDRYVTGLGYLTGANTLDVANVGVSVGLLRYLGQLDGADTIVADAYRRIHEDLVIHPEDRADGIRPDGSFGQHDGILYDGNYGKDYTNLVLDLETQAAGTQWAANSVSQDAFSLHIDGMAWMITNNAKTDTLHWDFSALGRFLTFPVIDKQATTGIKVNLTQIQELGQQWGSKTMQATATNLGKNVTDANAGNLVGNRMFYDNDYMVHRGACYVTTVKVLSKRTSNTECVNLANPLGFHLGQGVVFNYVSGNEYEDIMASWDWNLIPGITTDYAATPLACNTTQWNGNETFAGGVSSTSHLGLGVTAMKYTNPQTGNLKYRKAWFFFEDGLQHVAVSGIQSKTGADVYSVLDQKRRHGDIYVDGKAINAQGLGIQNVTAAKTLWHDGMGYTFDDPRSPGAGSSSQQQLSISYGNRTGNWSTIGTSAVNETTVDLFAAWIKHDPQKLTAPLSYSIYPGTDSYGGFMDNAKRRVKTVRNDHVAAAAVDKAHKAAMAVFWEEGSGGDVFIALSDLGLDATSWNGSVSRRRAHTRMRHHHRNLHSDDTSSNPASATTLHIQSDQALTLILDFKDWKVTVADPTHLLKTATLKLSLEKAPKESESSDVTGRNNHSAAISRTLNVSFPQGSESGKSVVLSLIK